MGAARSFNVAPFGGIVAGLDAKYLPQNAASDLLNVRLEDGLLACRYGFTSLASSEPASSFTSPLGFDFCKGWNEDLEPQAEYISIELHDETAYPFSLDAYTGAHTSITHAGSAVELPSGIWHSQQYDTVSFSWPIGGEPYYHLLGDLDHFRLVDTEACPDLASGGMVVGFSNQDIFDPDTEPDGEVNWDGADSNTISIWEDANTSTSATKAFQSETNDTMIWDLNETIVSGGSCYPRLRIDFSTLVAGNPDFSDTAQLRFRITHSQGSSSLNIDGVNYFKLIASTGEEVLFHSSAHWKVVKVFNGDGSTEHTITLTFRDDADPADVAALSDCRYLEGVFSFSAVGATTRADVTFHSIETWSNPGGAPDPDGTGHDIKFGFTFYKTEWDCESENVKESAEFYMQLPSHFYTGSGSGGDYLGKTATLYSDDPAVTGDEDIDAIRFYFMDVEEGIWRLIVETDYASGGYEVPFNYIELMEGTARAWAEYRPVGNINWAVPYAGAMVWLKPGGKDNVEVSAVGEPKKLWNSTQISEERGARLSMSPLLDDEPQWGGQSGDALIALGSRGAYATVGLKPIELTPFKKLPGSKGLIGPRAAARWKDDNGTPGIVYIGLDQELWFATVVPGFDGNQGYAVVELSLNQHGLIRSFLTQTDTPIVSGLSVAVLERSDSLWLTYEDRAIVLRRRDVTTGQRQWELYQYDSSWPLLAEDVYFGLRVMTASGTVDELEFDSADEFAAIVGPNRDGGAAVEGFWKSKTWNDERRRVRNVRIERDAASSSIEVDVITDRLTDSIEVASGKKNANCDYRCQGENVSVKVYITEDTDPVSLLTIEEVMGVSSRRDA